MPPTFGNGKICYIEIPTSDIDRAANFYSTVFGWNVRKRSEGSTGFDDGVGEVSGSWVLGRPPGTSVGILIHIMVDSAEATVEKIVANGGVIIQEIGKEAPEITARFTDLDGNIFSIYQEPASR
jgi:predicted enzyme related to lactoylglutathione lyase